MKQFNVSRRLTFLLTALGTATAVTVIAFTVLLRKSLTESSEVSTHATAQLSHSYTLLEALADAHGDIQSFLRLKDPDEMEKALAELTEHQKAAAELIANSGANSGGMTKKYESLVAAQKTVLDEVLRGNVADAYDKFFSSAAKEYEALLVELTAQNKSIQTAAKTALADHTAATQRSMFWSVGTIALALVGLLAFGWRTKRRIVRELRRVSDIIAQASSQLAGAIGQVSASSQSLAEGSSEQAASLEETSASLEEMASMTKRNAGNASKANDLARQARDAANAGANDMQAMSRAMNDIKTSSDDIAKIIKTIDEIAFQTNILALNAAVEAARAGEAGMGFAVVADEVRNLAQRSAQAAKDTAAKIEGAIDKSAQGVEINSKVANALNDILSRTRQVDELVAEVATASNEQSRGIEQVNTAIGQMDKVVQSNAANAEESAAAAEELNAQAESLKSVAAELLKLVGSSTRSSSSIDTTASGSSHGAVPSRAAVSGNGKADMSGPRHSSRVLNCWEFKKCGREAGGAKAKELGVCPAYPNHGRQCAHIAGTLCGGKVQGSFAQKLANCMTCEFFNSPSYDKTGFRSERGNSSAAAPVAARRSEIPLEGDFKDF